MRARTSLPKSPIGRCIYDWRNKTGMSFDKIRDATGLSKCILSKLETQKSPNPCYHTLRLIAGAFGVSLATLLKSLAKYEL